MTVTENDVIQNAAAIAALVNSTPAVEIKDLPLVTSWADTDLAHIQKAGVDSQIAKSNLGGGAGGDFEVAFPAGSFDLPDTNYAPFDTDSGVNGEIRRHLFDDTTEEFVEAQFVLPAAISGTVTFEIYGFAALAAASKNVEFTFYHSAKEDGEDWDAAYATKISGDLVPKSTQDQLDRFTFTETIATLGWTANDHIRIKLSRTPPSADNLSGDYGITNFKIIVPR